MSEANSIALLSDEAFGWYFTGLTDGEGCFHIQRYLRNGIPHHFNARFRMALRDDDGDKLESIARRFDCGKTYRVFKNNKIIKGAKPQTDWVIFRQSDLATKIVPHFERFPLQLKKGRDFEVWKHAVLLLARIARRKNNAGGRFADGTYGPKLTPEEVVYLDAAFARLREGKRYKGPSRKIEPRLQAVSPASLPLFPD